MDPTLAPQTAAVEPVAKAKKPKVEKTLSPEAILAEMSAPRKVGRPRKTATA
jgi:hypothetical protein